ncbi:outer membrane chaperone Skp (OmpH) [Denitrovibrio acetiphilus DSM 12809]|uniref:Outer membrane chaperone Skp (OmpH) n=1 Tax=Denitrovibrio acetiphilus (strain DSM 12809 / NBRC 114555 / N2460) TaxID=522772 RepID=D4H334_DENA2|nr:OmpH family outer membrane protein [Denitrovibrio acetiphilus]ADD69057.1 outer membrane chaperone Skp (OmpH) [Denitrovibrio acetiphilus DSM 12809]
MRRVSILVMVIMVAFSANAFAKIGVLDFQQVLKQSESGKEVYNKLQTQADDYDKKLQTLGDKIKNMQDEYTQKESIYKEDTKEKKRTEIQREIRNFNTAKEDYSKELKRLEMRHLKRVQDEVMKIVTDLGKELGYEVILEVQNSAVLYMADSVNITDNVIKRYDNVFKQGK